MHGHHHHHHEHDDARKHSHGEPFSAKELEYLQAEDRAAAKAVVSLMLGVFSLGLIGSIAVCMAIRG